MAKDAGQLAPRQERFVQEYLLDLNATQAAIRAGYSAKTAEVQGPRLLGNVRVAAAIEKAKATRAERVNVDADWILRKLVENVEKAMQAVPVLNRKGEPTGEYVYQGAVANKALELLGKHHGLFPDRHEHTGKDGGVMQIAFVEIPVEPIPLPDDPDATDEHNNEEPAAVS